MEFTHFDENGNAVMVDVSGKDVTRRVAVAEGVIAVSREVMDAIVGRKVKKGDVLTVAQVAGIMGTKRTSELIPMCHPLALTNAAVSFEVDEAACEIKATCRAVIEGKTGVEMEALTGVSTALLTIYDMCKAIDKRMVIREIHLVEKSGGKSGEFRFWRRRSGAVNGIVKLEALGGNIISATISMAAIEELGLKEGVDAIAVVKATSVMVGR